MARVAAVDLGASSGRVVVGDVTPDQLALTEVGRFANEPVRLGGGLHWDPLELHRHVLAGLRTAVGRSSDGLESVAVDSWAVDYGLLRGPRLLGVPFHYRDARTAAGVERVHARVPFADLYRRNGLQFLPFNTLYQLAADDLLDLADGLLLMPDLIGYWLTGERRAEHTNASTTGLVRAGEKDWDTELIDLLGLDGGLLAPIARPGEHLGVLTPEVAEVVGSPGLPVTHVGSHDTASAVVGVPMTEDGGAYISCGTWGLVGVEVDEPVVTDASRAANFTNEAGVDGRTRLLTNVMGTWLLSETLRTWSDVDHVADLAPLLRAAADVTGPVPVFDVQDERFVAPGDMPARIAAWFAERGLRAPEGRARVVRSIVESLAQGFADAVAAVESVAGREVRTVHVVGGGSRNTLLCQAVADRTGRPVLAGPVEATAIGNVLVQARSVGAVGGTLEDLRDLVARTHDLVRYHPATD